MYPAMKAHNITAASDAAKGGLREQDLAGFEALRSASAVFELAFRAKIKLTGEDRVRWLNGMVTNNVRDLAAGYGVYAFLLNPQGHILGDLYAYNRGDCLLIDTDRGQLSKIRATFEHYIIMDDVDVAEAGDMWSSLGIAGQDATGILKSVGMNAGELKPLQFVDLTWNGSSVMVVRGDNSWVPWYELWLPQEKHGGLLAALVTAGASALSEAQDTQSTPGALEMLRLASGIPRYGQDIRERDLPQETEQQRALHFSKGCYIGQEIVERIRSRGSVHRKFTGFTVSGLLPAGTRLQLAGKDVGEITSNASLPLPKRQGAFLPVALGYVRREINVGTELSAGDSKVVVASLPFEKILRTEGTTNA
jgi:folate-binding protein YgfZ